jgi:hypothetical protein
VKDAPDYGMARKLVGEITFFNEPAELEKKNAAARGCHLHGCKC